MFFSVYQIQSGNMVVLTPLTLLSVAQAYHILASVAVILSGGFKEFSWLCKVVVDRNVE